MTEHDDNLLSAAQLVALESAFHRGSTEASAALAKWIGKPSLVEIDSLEQLPLEAAGRVLTEDDQPICCCATEIKGLLGGQMILAFDDASGLGLADILLEQPQGSTAEWSEMASSAALETTNIICCAYLNALSRSFSESEASTTLLPTPPTFRRDFPESLLQFALMGQAVASDQVILTRTRFEIDSTPMNWTLLFVPDGESMSRLGQLLLRDVADK